MSDALIHKYAKNPYGRDLVVGDVHGCFEKLNDTLDTINFDVLVDRLFSVGDLIDRGPSSQSVTEWLELPWFCAVTGNHEQMACEYYWGNLDEAHYRMNGGAWFIELQRFEQAKIVAALKRLPIAIEIETELGTVAIVHAACDYPTWGAFKSAIAGPLGTRHIENAVWGRDRANGESFGPVGDVRAVVVGHTPSQEIHRIDNVVFIDTGGWIRGGQCGNVISIIDAATLEPALAPVAA